LILLLDESILPIIIFIIKRLKHMRSFTTAILAVIGVLSIQVNAQEVENPLYNLFRKKALI